MGDLIDALGPAAPFGAAVLLLALVGRWVSTEIRHHFQQRHTQALEREKHDLEKHVLEAQLGQTSAQQVAHESLYEQVENIQDEGYRLGWKEAERQALLNQLRKEMERLNDFRVRNDHLTARLERAMVEGAAPEDLKRLTSELAESRKALDEANHRVAELVSKMRHPSRAHLFERGDEE